MPVELAQGSVASRIGVDSALDAILIILAQGGVANRISIDSALDAILIKLTQGSVAGGISVDPTLTVSGLPARIENGTIVLGPVTAYSGHTPVTSEGPWGENRMSASLERDDGEVRQVSMSFVPWDALGPLERMMARDQAVVVGADPGLLEGAFMAWVPIPEEGVYSVSCILTNDIGSVRSGDGAGSWIPPGITYGGIEVEGDAEDDGFPYLVVFLFALLSAIMLFITYLRYPARMRAMTAGRQGRDERERRTVERRLEDHVRTGRR